MTSQRPYRSSLSVEEARKEIAGQLGTQFDPTIGQVFLDMISTGEILSGDQSHSEGG